MTRAEQRKRAVKLTLPVFCGYIVLGIAFGATLAQAGYGSVWALAISTLVYAGSLQFVMVPFLAGGTSLIAVALTALMVNARHLFYGLSCIERFGRMDKRIRPYMITSLTDETYSVFCGLSNDEEDGVMFRVTLYDQIYWIVGSILGTLLAQGLPFDLTGIDFSMTALFVVICVEKALEVKNRVPMAIGTVCALAMLFLLGPSAFLAPALGLTAILLTERTTRSGRRLYSHPSAATGSSASHAAACFARFQPFRCARSCCFTFAISPESFFASMRRAGCDYKIVPQELTFRCKLDTLNKLRAEVAERQTRWF